MVFEQPEVSDLNVDFWSVLVPAVAGLGLFSAVVVFTVGRSFMTRQTAGVDEMIGSIGRTTTALDPDGKVFIRGEYWNASAETSIGPNESVEVVAVEGLRLRVRRAVSAR